MPSTVASEWQENVLSAGVGTGRRVGHPLGGESYMGNLIVKQHCIHRRYACPFLAALWPSPHSCRAPKPLWTPGFNCVLGVRAPRSHATVKQPDGKYLIGGSMTSVKGVVRYGIARLLASGEVDPR